MSHKDDDVKKNEWKKRKQMLFIYMFSKKKKFIKLSKLMHCSLSVSHWTLFNDSRKNYSHIFAQLPNNTCGEIGLQSCNFIWRLLPGRGFERARARRERTSVSVSRHLSLGTECVDAFRIGGESRIPVRLFRVDEERNVYI